MGGQDREGGIDEIGGIKLERSGEFYFRDLFSPG